MPIMFKNDTATPVGLWDISPQHRVAAPYGGSVTLDPDQTSQSVIDAYVAAGAGSSLVLVAPANTVIPAITGTASVGQTLTGTNGTWTGTPAPTYTLQWKADGADIAGATAATYELTAAELGKVITLSVTATNTVGSAEATSTATSAVVAALTAPVNTAVPTITGTVQIGDVLTSTNGTWTGNPTPTYTLVWERGDAAEGPFTAIDGATATTYTLVEADEGKYIRCSVTGTNSQGSATENSAAVGPVTTSGAG